MTKVFKVFLLTAVTGIIFSSCSQSWYGSDSSVSSGAGGGTVARSNKGGVTYRIAKPKDSSIRQLDSRQMSILASVNRMDVAHLNRAGTIIVPNSLSSTYELSPFPKVVSGLKDVPKIIFFSYPAQFFGAYENGRLVHTGPTSMGSAENPTPTGLYFTNWKAVERVSSFNDEWIMKWNFNIEDQLGIGWHEYDLPGYPASHSCLRLLSSDAIYLYDWADQWVVADVGRVVKKGTPVIVFGSYPFGGAKPWLALVDNPRALDISEGTLVSEAQPRMQQILAR